MREEAQVFQVESGKIMLVKVENVFARVNICDGLNCYKTDEKAS